MVPLRPLPALQCRTATRLEGDLDLMSELVSADVEGDFSSGVGFNQACMLSIMAGMRL